jgi:hypothetical protein
MSISSHSSHALLSPPPPIPSWPLRNGRYAQSGEVPAGLYELSPPRGNHAPYSIVLYAKASHFLDLDCLNQGQVEFSKVLTAFTINIPVLFPDARVLLLWNVTQAFTTRDLLV